MDFSKASAANGGTLVNLDESHLDTPVFRTYSFERLVQLIVDRKDALVSPQKWEDPFENFFLAHTMVATASGELGTLESLAGDWYGQCWTYGGDSDAMWRIYSHDRTVT